MFRKYVFQMGLLLSLLLCGACSEFNGKEAEVAFPDVPEYEVPAVSGITVDGRLDDWAAAGLEVKALAPLSGRVPDPDDLSAKVRLGWTTEGLLVAIDVRDDVAREAPVGGRLFRGDCIHLYYAERRGGRNTYQAIITPGRDADAPETRIMLSDRRKQAKELGAINLDYKFTHYDQGYRFEALLPWSAVGTEATEGATAALQVFVADADRGEGMTQGWYPERGDWRKALALQPLVMRSDKAVPPLSASAFSRVSDMSHISIAVAASSDIADRSVHAVSRSGMRVQTELVDRGGVLEAYMHWPLARDNDSAEPVAVYAGSRLLGVLSPPHLDQERIREYVQTSVEFKPALFTGDRFPSFDYPDPEYMERLVGPYEKAVTFYNRDFEEVSAPGEYGRYGAIVRINPAYAPPVRHYLTVYRAPGTLKIEPEALSDSLVFPEEMGIETELLNAWSEHLSTYIESPFKDISNAGAPLAALWAGLEEASREKVFAMDVVHEPATRDRQWWTELRRGMSGNAEKYPADFAYPLEIRGQEARVLKTGSPEEAGMRTGASAAIDGVLKEWAENSDLGFTALVARHGVIVHHKAYGERFGKTMTTDTVYPLASITKSFFGACVMMLFDSGRIDSLEDEVAKYLPAFREKNGQVTTPLTIMHCMTHTNGMWGHWGVDMPGFAWRIAAVYDELTIGRWPGYNGGGYVTMSRLLEQVSGEALPVFYQKHLFQPLGCESTVARGPFGDAGSTAMDVGRFAQMLLNKGAYGRYRYFSEENYEKMIPRNWGGILTDPGRDWMWGVGQMHFGDEKPLGPNTFGHGSATSCILRIDPDNDLIIVMARFGRSQNYDKYKQTFFDTIYEQILADTKAE